MDYLRESFVGTLERCLKSLEESWEVSVHPARSLEKSKDVSVHITSNYLKQVWWLKWLSGISLIIVFILIKQGWEETEMLSEIRGTQLWSMYGSGVVKGGAKTGEESHKCLVLTLPKSVYGNQIADYSRNTYELNTINELNQEDDGISHIVFHFQSLAYFIVAIACKVPILSSFPCFPDTKCSLSC